MQRQRVWVKTLSKDEKRTIALTCERFIAEVLVPRFLPEVRPTRFNYPVALYGKWHGDRYRFLQRYRSGFPDNAGEEFDSAFARLDHETGDRFHLMWQRHTGQWLCLRPSVTLEEALRLIETEGLVQPNPP